MKEIWVALVYEAVEVLDIPFEYPLITSIKFKPL